MTFSFHKLSTLTLAVLAACSLGGTAFAQEVRHDSRELLIEPTAQQSDLWLVQSTKAAFIRFSGNDCGSVCTRQWAIMGAHGGSFDLVNNPLNGLFVIDLPKEASTEGSEVLLEAWGNPSEGTVIVVKTIDIDSPPEVIFRVDEASIDDVATGLELMREHSTSDLPVIDYLRVDDLETAVPFADDTLAVLLVGGANNRPAEIFANHVVYQGLARDGFDFYYLNPFEDRTAASALLNTQLEENRFYIVENGVLSPLSYDILDSSERVEFLAEADYVLRNYYYDQ